MDRWRVDRSNVKVQDFAREFQVCGNFGTGDRELKIGGIKPHRFLDNPHSGKFSFTQPWHEIWKVSKKFLRTCNFLKNILANTVLRMSIHTKIYTQKCRR